MRLPKVFAIPTTNRAMKVGFLLGRSRLINTGLLSLRRYKTQILLERKRLNRIIYAT